MSGAEEEEEAAARKEKAAAGGEGAGTTAGGGGDSDEDDEDVYEVEKILDVKTEDVSPEGGRALRRQRRSWQGAFPLPCSRMLCLAAAGLFLLIFSAQLGHKLPRDV